MAKAKTASKNNPLGREKAKEFLYNGKKVKPVKLISNGRNYMAVQYEDGKLANDEKGQPVPWGKLKS